MKKILIAICALILFTGCSCSLNDQTPEKAVDTFFEKYRAKDDNVITQLVDTIENEGLVDKQKKDYQELMEATATVELTVLNYRSAILEAEKELKDNPEKFNDENGKFSESKYMDYKIELMSKVTDTTTHTMELYLTKENGMWKVNELSSDDISKLHGLY